LSILKKVNLTNLFIFVTVEVFNLIPVGKYKAVKVKTKVKVTTAESANVTGETTTKPGLF